MTAGVCPFNPLHRMTDSSHAATLLPDVRPSDAFRSLLWDSDEMCNRCFRRIRTVNHRAVRERGRHTARQQLAGSEARHVAHDGAREYLEDGPTVFCECGSERGRAADQTLSADELAALAPRIADRLKAKNVPVDRSTLEGEIYQRKSDPDATSRDTEILDQATEHAIRAAAGARTRA